MYKSFKEGPGHELSEEPPYSHIKVMPIYEKNGNNWY